MISQRFTPVIDYFETAVKQVHTKTGIPEPVASGSEPPKYQYQRAYILSKDLSDQLYTFSTEQINTIRTQNVYVQRATEAAHRVTAVASSSYGAAQEKVHAVSDVMLQELQRVQVRLICVVVQRPSLIFSPRSNLLLLSPLSFKLLSTTFPLT